MFTWMSSVHSLGGPYPEFCVYAYWHGSVGGASPDRHLEPKPALRTPHHSWTLGPLSALAPCADCDSLQVGSRWASPEDPCLINECVRVKEEVFVQQRNVSCPQLDFPTCPVGFQQSCKTLECCPSCRCGKSRWPDPTFKPLFPLLNSLVFLFSSPGKWASSISFPLFLMLFGEAFPESCHMLSGGF